jgi:hypothetical protein
MHCRSAQSAHLGLGDPEDRSPALLQKSQPSTATRTFSLVIPGSPNILDPNLSLRLTNFRSTTSRSAAFWKLFPLTTQGCRTMETKRIDCDIDVVHRKRWFDSLFAICSGSPSLGRLFSMCTLKPMMPPLATSECFYLARSAELQSSQITVSEMLSSSGIVNIPAQDCMNHFLLHL